MPLIIAHRGASRDAPENTFAAFKRAVDAGADGIELDVRLARDGVAVVFHDHDLERTAGKKGKVASFTSGELAKIDIGSWFNRYFPRRADPSFRKESIRTLAETLEFLKDYRGVIYIELKCKSGDIEGLAKAVASVICDSPLLDRLIIKSFKLDVLPYIKRYCPRAHTAALFAPKIKNILRKDKHLFDLAEKVGANEVSLHYSLATKKLMKKASRRGLLVTIWTADHPRWIKRGLRLGLNAIITNDPVRMIAKRDEIMSASA